MIILAQCPHFIARKIEIQRGEMPGWAVPGHRPSA